MLKNDADTCLMSQNHFNYTRLLRILSCIIIILQYGASAHEIMGLK